MSRSLARHVMAGIVLFVAATLFVRVVGEALLPSDGGLMVAVTFVLTAVLVATVVAAVPLAGALLLAGGPGREPPHA